MWKIIPGYGWFYRISSSGKIQSRKVRGHPGVYGPWVTMKCGHDGDGYKQASLSNFGKQKTQQVHKLILHIFVGKPKPGQVARHLDGNKLNNHVDNLIWGTVPQNIQDKKTHGTQCHGPRKRGNLTVQEVQEIRGLYEKTSAQKIADRFGVSRQTVYRTCCGRRKRDGKRT